ncbi:uncharacterized protein BDR25DRAFT_226806 [Lindgomyces ingoldianus]|uniref:Uncharacterized protein n=1 Tax=Lindgomyces ingoldianus TaxID=673940 RepID=A0ACB6QVS5_9PLEO|nr:uncharacterized protein BDR25DRAFT_226806 [Lindgomyces ingoldianus]KAF2470167.1 hypothetical protein BDR25DRAFT_226806 [Lindgomyces ingoldianus]
MLPGPASTPEHVPKKPTDQQLNRACEACRLSKVRCLMNPIPGSSQCQRCAKAGRTCVFAPPAKRRQRKRTDVRVAELEREVRQMRSLLRSNRISPVETSDHESGDEDAEDAEIQTEKASPAYAHSHESNTTPATNPEKWISNRSQDDCRPKDTLGASDIDIIDRGLISKEMAEELLEIYRNDLVIACPGVVIPSEWTATELRFKKPALFHAVMAAASHCKGATLSNRLHEEVVYLYARSLFIKGEKSLQYIQALIVTVAYYTPPNSPAQLQIYQYGNMAASMALELGLASKPRTHEQLPKRAIRSLQRISSAEELLENCRTILILYVLTAGFAMRLRRPNILLYNSWMEECLSLLQKSPILDDRRLVAWLKLQRIADEAMTAFGFDDASTSFSLSELRLQVILRIFERRMQDWKKSIPPEVMTLTLMIEHHQNICSMYEFAMDGGRYDAPEFKNRHLTLPALDDDCIQPETLLSRSALQINATIKCISHAHALLDCFLQVSVENLQKSPNLLFVRAIYALVTLLKADYAVGTDAEGMGEVLDSRSLKIDYYMDTVLRKATEAIGPQKCRVPSHWLFVLNHKLKTWHDEHQAWRKEGRHLKRNPPREHKDPNEIPMPENPPPPFGEMKSQEPASTQPMPTPAASTPGNPSPGQIPTFGMPNAYSTWPANGISITSTDSTQFPADLTDFSTAFQHGDLYLWNDVNDNFGGWIPQGGSIYSEMQFGGMNGPPV